MAKHTSKEAYYERLKNLSGANKTSLKESGIRNLGTLIDYKRAPDGIAYGIIKENHHYYLKKAGTKQDPNVSDFAYIGGMANITGYQFKSLSEADKQRNMIFHTINEAVSLKPDKNGGNKKRRLHEGDASTEIDQASSKLGDLDAATSAEKAPAEPVAPEGGDEMAAGLDAKPMGGEETPAPDMGGAPEGGAEELPAPDMGGEEGAPDGGEELPAPDDTEGVPDGGEGDVTADDLAEPVKEIEKSIGKITEKIRKTDLEDSQVKSFINSFVSAFKDKLRDIDIEDRKEMANNILKVVDQEEIEDLGDSIPQGEPEGGAPEAGIEEEQCAECGGFGKYAESRGYGSPEAFMECDDEEKASVIGGYANAHNDGMNDGDFKTIAIVITPEILEKLKGDYGHDEYAEKLTPYTQEMNESSDEDKMTKLNELWGGLKSAGQKIGGAVQGAVKSAGQAIGQKATDIYNAGAEKVGQAKQAVGGAVQGVKQAYNAGEVSGEIKKLQDVAVNLGKQIEALNKRKAAAGQEQIDVKNILKAVTQQVTGKGAGVASLGENVAVDPSNTQVGVPGMLKEEDEEVEKDEIDVDVDNLDVDDNDEKPFVKSGDKPLEFAPAAQSLGVTTVKPDGAPTTGVDITISPDKEVSISMNESEVKLRKYVRARLEEMVGMRKPKLNESKKSPTMKKLDEVIAKQYVLYETAISKKK